MWRSTCIVQPPIIMDHFSYLLGWSLSRFDNFPCLEHAEICGIKQNKSWVITYHHITFISSSYALKRTDSLWPFNCKAEQKWKEWISWHSPYISSHNYVIFPVDQLSFYHVKCVYQAKVHMVITLRSYTNSTEMKNISCGLRHRSANSAFLTQFSLACCVQMWDSWSSG